jgi:hypothetical protein
MKIHSDILTEQDIRAAVPQNCYLAGHYVDGEWASVHPMSSRTRERAFSVRLSGTSRYGMTNLPDKAATWDEWGIFLAELFKIDPNAVLGSYKSRDDFIRITCDEHNRIKLNRADLLPTHSAPWLAHN